MTFVSVLTNARVKLDEMTIITIMDKNHAIVIVVAVSYLVRMSCCYGVSYVQT